MGSIRKDARGVGWQARYRDRSGRQRTRTFASKAEARTFLGTVETDLAKGTWTDPALAKVRFSTYAIRWRETLAHLRPGTLNNVDSFLHCNILPAFGTWPMGRIEPADVRGFVADLVGNRQLLQSRAEECFARQEHHHKFRRSLELLPIRLRA